MQKPKIPLTKITDLKPNIHFQLSAQKHPFIVDFIVLEPLTPVQVKNAPPPPTGDTQQQSPQQPQQHVMYQTLVADDTAAIIFCLWDYSVEKYGAINPGDILRLSNGMVNLWRNQLQLYQGKKGTLERVGEFLMAFNETKNMTTQFEWIEEPPNSKKYVCRPNTSTPGATNAQINTNAFATSTAMQQQKIRK